MSDFGTFRHDGPDTVGISFRESRLRQGPRDPQHDVVVGLEAARRNGHLVAGRE